MRYGHIAGSSKPISRIVQGTSIAPVSMSNRDGCFALFDGVFAQGITAFDTAHQYAHGDAERLLGQWMHERGAREQVFVLSKCAHHTVDRRRVTPADITADLMDSLARLDTDYVDLYVLHRDDPSVPVGPIVEVLNEHHDAGRIQAFGGSNWSVERLQEANEYAALHGLAPFAASSVHLSLTEQIRPPWRDCLTLTGSQAQGARDWYARTQTPLFAWSSLSGGFCTGRFTRTNLDTFTAELDRLVIDSYASDDNFKRLERAQQLAATRGLTLPQLALAYVLNQPLNVFALIGHQSSAEAEETGVACDVTLSMEELDWLDLKRE
jgi:aryl-alcohol dehydrogenase-like predicted oxidoreductase